MTTGKQQRKEDAGGAREAAAGRAQSGPARSPQAPRAPQGQRKPPAAGDDDERTPDIDDEEE